MDKKRIVRSIIPIYVYVRVGDKTVSIKADDLQKALDYVTEHGEEVTIEGRRTDG